jgi:membrane-bound lytic murein transglycosylase F
MSRVSFAMFLVLFITSPFCSPVQPTDLSEIRARGKLIAITGYDATSYFIYKGRPMGYEFELLSLLANHLGLKLEIMISKDRDELFRLLERGEGDILAANLTVTGDRAEEYTFTDFLMTTRQVLVQKKPDGWQRMKLHEIDDALIRNPIELSGKTVHVREGSSYYDRLQNLSSEIGGGIGIIPVASDVPTEELIRQVAEGEIAYTVADENLAMINLAYYPGIDIATEISLPQQIAWVIRDRAPELLEAVNGWIREARKGVAYHAIYEKYFMSRRGFRERLSGDILTEPSAQLSPYDDLLKARAAVIGWDWRLLASQVYQESLFDPNATSWAGAVGLMQLLPETAVSFGAVDIEDPIENIMAGTSYIRWLEDYWDLIPDAAERRKFVLASYNVGYGHVEDARRLASKFGADQNRWEGHVATFMLRLSNPLYYGDEVVKNGYCRGEEPVNYVDEIFERYEHYRRFVPPAV